MQLFSFDVSCMPPRRCDSEIMTKLKVFNYALQRVYYMRFGCASIVRERFLSAASLHAHLVDESDKNNSDALERLYAEEK